MVSENPMRELQRLGQEFDASPIEDLVERRLRALAEYLRDEGEDEAAPIVTEAAERIISQSQSIRVMREALERARPHVVNASVGVVPPESEVEAGLEAILAKSDDEIMDEELFQLFGKRKRFTRDDVLRAMAYSFEQGKNHILMLREAEKQAAMRPTIPDDVEGLVEKVRKRIRSVVLEDASVRMVAVNIKDLEALLSFAGKLTEAEGAEGIGRPLRQD